MAWRSTSTSSTDRGGPSGLLEVGRITKPHGIRGEVVVVLTSDRSERVAPGAQLQTKAGALLLVDTSRPHQNGWLVRFEGIADRTQAEDLRDTVLYAEPLDDPDELWVHELIGARVIDQHGADLGLVTAVEDNPAADLLVLESGVLIPMTFVVGGLVDGHVTVDIPDGLLDL